MDAGRSLHVLIVDDDKDTADSFAALIELWGRVAVAVTTADAALDEVCRFWPDVILADIAMPRVSGLQFAKALRQIPEHGTTPLVAVTGMQGHREACLAAGFSDFLLKPVDLKELRGILDALRETNLHSLLMCASC
jgi:CheY-like chemotaxis protein